MSDDSNRRPPIRLRTSMGRVVDEILEYQADSPTLMAQVRYRVGSAKFGFDEDLWFGVDELMVVA